MATYLGVDLGATTVRAAVGDRAGRIVGADRRETPAGPTGVTVTEAVLDTVRGACADAGVDPEAVVAAGVGAVGPLDHDAGVAVDPTNLPSGVGRIPLVGPLRTLLSTDRTYFHNDATAGAIGERFFRDGGEDLVYLTLSTGVGAGAVVDGHVLSGWDGNAAEVGHVTVDPDDDARACGCGGTGHWEAYCGGANVPGYARDRHDGEATALDLDAADLDAAAVFDAAAAGDEFAARVVDRIGRWNALGVATVVHAYAPRVVAVGGGVVRNNPDRILGPIRDRLPSLLRVARTPEVRLTDRDGDAVVRGALASAITGGTGDPADG
jgi:glucokinase